MMVKQIVKMYSNIEKTKIKPEEEKEPDSPWTVKGTKLYNQKKYLFKIIIFLSNYKILFFQMPELKVVELFCGIGGFHEE